MENRSTKPGLYNKIEVKAQEIENELKRLNRWQREPLPQEKFENMGAFGSNTMAFEQWIQFILLSRIQEIIKEHSDLPTESHLSAYAVRTFDGDYETDILKDLLYELDQLINGTEPQYFVPDPDSPAKQYVAEIKTIPDVVFTLADLLPQFKGDDLESQLQSFDAFLSMLDPANRQVISDLLADAAAKTSDPLSKERIQKASRDVAQGGRAAEPYHHGEAMRKYVEEHKKNYPS